MVQRLVHPGRSWLVLLALGLVHPAAATWEEITLTIDGVPREASLHVPDAAADQPAPLVFVFHGHGGNRRSAARSMALHEAWPGALVVYPQGLPTPGALTDPEGHRNGWQHGAGDQDDRDLHFVDALLRHLRDTHPFDPNRVFATGHSNGGGFTYLLWAERAGSFAAFAPSAASAGRVLRAARPAPRPLFHLLGTNDPLVKPAWQTATLALACRINGAPRDGDPWDGQPGTIWRRSANGPPVVTFTHDGGHRFPREATALIARFFREVSAAPTAADTTR